MICEWLRESGEGLYIFVKVQPRASKNSVAGLIGKELKVTLTAPPVDSAANEALVEFLAKMLRCKRSNVTLVKGESSRHKTVFVTGMKPQCVIEYLNLK